MLTTLLHHFLGPENEDAVLDAMRYRLSKAFPLIDQLLAVADAAEVIGGKEDRRELEEEHKNIALNGRC